jgi:thymidine kinase
VANLRFHFGTMGAGKSTLALQIHHNLGGTGNGVLITQHDREGAAVSSALGVSAAATVIGPDDDLCLIAKEAAASAGGLDYLVCDEAQFYTPDQVDQLARIVDDMGADVHAFGLLTDFRGRLFAGTARLLEVADERTELQVQSRCWCGQLATHNARLVDGTQVYDGEVVVVDDGSITDVTYELRCRKHWNEGIGTPKVERLRSVG